VGDRQRFSQNHPTGIEQFLHIFLLPCRLSDISLLILQLERTREIMDLRPEGISADMLIRGIVLHYRKPNGTVFTHNAADILYVEAEADLCILHFLDDQGECRKITLQKNITAIEWNCNPKTFFRIHRKYLVNMLHVLDYGDYPGISLHLKTNGTPVELPLSRRRKLDFHNNYKYIRTLRNVLS
jgi:DNA-binding LytR/AlgR family response regulator